jgi:hypothetical protein
MTSRAKQPHPTAQSNGSENIHQEMQLPALQSTGYSAHVEFCLWLLGSLQLRTKMLFTDEATFNSRNDWYTEFTRLVTW